ncbi:hypothetical protein ONS95_003835 [Cadophora gregata]|uniref:uncharacterized protein n=1 Tax=Cadophora gregata TaxID=51156 RepID=UPI0026DBC790|nr:uncharacterized protein ONS95_003835 [Cadophora gregata]KAK0107129.1 hypothetical protein ONS95_003835 [Cadophora gregata]KAK0116814.1 hypothetical protein ONS96_012663 [Cadophora gregata f. sp. sojae]
MEFPRPEVTSIKVLLSNEDPAITFRPSQNPCQISESKVVEPIHTIRSVDGASDTDGESSMPKPTRSKTDPLTPKRIESPHFWKPTKASRARSQATRAKASRKNTSGNETVVTNFQDTKKSTDAEEAVTVTSQSESTSNGAIPSDMTEIFVVLQYDSLFPHCKAQGVFMNIVDANNKVIELFNEDEAQRGSGENRGKVQPYISEHGCLQYYRHKTNPKGMVWVTRAPLYRSMAHSLAPWPNEEEMTVLWSTSGPARRRAAGWDQKR